MSEVSWKGVWRKEGGGLEKVGRVWRKEWLEKVGRVWRMLVGFGESW